MEPVRPSNTPSSRPRSRYHAKMARSATCNTPPASAGRRANRKRRRQGTVRTHCCRWQPTRIAYRFRAGPIPAPRTQRVPGPLPTPASTSPTGARPGPRRYRPPGPRSRTPSRWRRRTTGWPRSSTGPSRRLKCRSCPWQDGGSRDGHAQKAPWRGVPGTSRGAETSQPWRRGVDIGLRVAPGPVWAASRRPLMFLVPHELPVSPGDGNCTLLMSSPNLSGTHCILMGPEFTEAI